MISNFLISLLGRFYANLLINNVLCSQLDKFYLQFIHIYLEKYHITSLGFFLQINTLTFVMHNKRVQKKVNQYQGKVCLVFFQLAWNLSFLCDELTAASLLISIFYPLLNELYILHNVSKPIQYTSAHASDYITLGPT